MPAPDTAGLVGYLGLTGSPTAGQTEAFGAAMAWARKALGVPADDTLAGLDLDNVRAVYGYAADLLKLPKTQFGYFAADGGEDLAGMVGDIARRWIGPLQFGHRTGVPFA
jgi:hypothetical protein